MGNLNITMYESEKVKKVENWKKRQKPLGIRKSGRTRGRYSNKICWMYSPILSFFYTIPTTLMHGSCVSFVDLRINNIFDDFSQNNLEFPRDHNVFLGSIRQYGGHDARTAWGALAGVGCNNLNVKRTKEF